MSRRHAITLKALFPILTAALLAAACSDPTEPHGDPIDAFDTLPPSPLQHA